MNAARYARSAIVLHWAIAFLLLFQLGLGWHMTSMGQGAPMYAAFQFHKSIGITVLLLSVLRVGVRIFKRSPPPPVETGRWTGLLVKLVHFGLYGFMIAGPLTGWAVASTAKVAIPTRLFGTLPWPHLPISQAWNDYAAESHEALAWIGLGLVALHFAGAIRHHLGGGRDNVIGRMIPVVAGAAASRWAIPAALLAAGTLALAFLAPWLLYRAAPKMPEASSSAAPIVNPTQASLEPAGGGAGPAAPPLSKPIGEQTGAAAEAPATDAIGPVKWKVQGGGRLGFVASMNGTAIEGRFEQWTADILFSPDALPQSKITVRVPLLSVNTANDERDGLLKGVDFFGSAGTALFRSADIRHIGGERYEATGSLSMNGASHPLTLAFTLHIGGGQASVTGSTQLDRTAFGIGAGQWASTDQIAGNVEVNFKFDAKKVK